MQPIDNGSEPSDQLGVTIPEFIEISGLLLEYCEDRIWSLAPIDYRSKWVVADIFPCAFGVLCYGSIEKCLEIGGVGCCIKCRGHGDDGHC